MKKRYGQTEMGGSQQVFQTTRWTEIINARTLDQARQDKAIGDLISKCWKPVYCYLRRKGYSNDSAKDMTQGFFYEVVLGRELIQKASQIKGKFRTFLLTALDRYVTDIYRKDNAKKRSPDGQMVSVEMGDWDDISEIQTELEPDQAFNSVWALQILNQVLQDVEEYCSATDRKAYWNVFHAKVVLPILDCSDPPSLKELCKKYGIVDEPKASNMISYVKVQFRSAMMKCLSQLVESDEEAEEEFDDIFKILSNRAAR